MNDFLEIKLHKNKPAQRFRCTLLHREPAHAVLRYVSAKPGQIADMRIKPGSTTVAHYWTHRPYVAWRMFDRATCLIGTLFHISSHTRLSADRLSYEDLLLDVWIDPDGSLRVLDEDELQECTAAGLISAAENDYIRAVSDHITGGHAAIIAGLEEFERSHWNKIFPAPDCTQNARDTQPDDDV